jgi:hypothetical protein
VWRPRRSERTLADDIWTVWQSPDAGDSFGVDYQLVMDFGRDGRSTRGT